MFDISSSQDFYAMLVQDFDEFIEDQQSSRRAIHCAITAYHLHEWVWGDWLGTDYLTRKALSIRDKESFLAWIDKACPWFSSIQALANGSKHFIRKPGFDTQKIQGYGQGPYGVGPYGQPYLLIDFGEQAAEHRFYPAGALLEVVVRFWRDFFKLYHPIPDLPASKYHVD
ncbi:MAG: hypothetical protein LAN70_05025 [Acidobacteriia bacterium]|nr:hypothetical protein [Terriglobia bacterium]